MPRPAAAEVQNLAVPEHRCGNISARFGVLRERMLLRFSPSMMRKVLALLVLVIASGLAPATAIIGFCAKMPCCFGEAQDGPVLATNMADCCTTISCYEGPPHDLAVSGKVKAIAATTPVMLSVAPAIQQAPVARRTFDDTSPPPTTSERLSSLSVFLI